MRAPLSPADVARAVAVAEARRRLRHLLDTVRACTTCWEAQRCPRTTPDLLRRNAACGDWRRVPAGREVGYQRRYLSSATPGAYSPLWEGEEWPAMEGTWNLREGGALPQPVGHTPTSEEGEA